MKVCYKKINPALRVAFNLKSNVESEGLFACKNNLHSNNWNVNNYHILRSSSILYFPG